jgi:hypothetical protein
MPKEGELAPEGLERVIGRPRGSMKDRLDWRDQQKQSRRIEREPVLEDQREIQPTQVVTEGPGP